MSTFTKSVIAIQLAIALSLFLQLWIGEGSIAHVWQLNIAIDKQHAENKVLIDRNELLMAEVHALQEGLVALEERARLELGLIKPNETFFQIVD